MGQPVVHFEVVGSDGEALRSYYAEMFGWEMDADNPMSYGVISRADLARRAVRAAQARTITAQISVDVDVE